MHTHTRNAVRLRHFIFNSLFSKYTVRDAHTHSDSLRRQPHARGVHDNISSARMFHAVAYQSVSLVACGAAAGLKKTATRVCVCSPAHHHHSRRTALRVKMWVTTIFTHVCVGLCIVVSLPLFVLSEDTVDTDKTLLFSC